MLTPLKKVLIQAMAAMAWADGTIDDAQRHILRDLFEEEELSPELAKHWLDVPVEFPCPEELANYLPDISDRLDLVTQLLHMAATDSIMHRREADLLASLGHQFGVSPEVLEELTRSVQD
jgi:uncharacterized membrane protein YebE (DUF533 family)